MFSESNDPVENISDLMPSTTIKIGEEEYKYSYEPYPEITAMSAGDRAFVYQEENQVDKLFQLAPEVPKSEAFNLLKNIDMQDPQLILTLISKGNEIVKRCNELDDSKVSFTILKEGIEIGGMPFNITYLPENSMYRETYEKRIRNRIKR